MKEIIKDILPFQEKDFLSPLRNKVDYARLVALSARILLIDYDSNGMVINSQMKLLVDKMSRLFFYSQNKYFSVSFPFNIVIDNNKVTEITTYTGKNVDNKNISIILSILDDSSFKLNPSPIDFWFNTNSVNFTGFSLLEEILQFEPSYIRYENDPINQNGKLHPLHHLDINYSSYGTYKIGLPNIIAVNYFENILNVTTDCSFISD